MCGSKNSIEKLSEVVSKLWEPLQALQENMQNLAARVALLESKMSPTQEPHNVNPGSDYYLNNGEVVLHNLRGNVSEVTAPMIKTAASHKFTLPSICFQKAVELESKICSQVPNVEVVRFSRSTIRPNYQKAIDMAKKKLRGLFAEKTRTGGTYAAKIGDPFGPIQHGFLNHTQRTYSSFHSSSSASFATSILPFPVPSVLCPKYITNYIPDPNYVRLFNTALRNSEIPPGASMTPKKKLDIAFWLMKLGNVIDNDRHVTLNVGLSRCIEKNNTIAWEVVTHAKRPQIHTSIATNAINMENNTKQVGNVAFELEIPDTATIHPVFHTSLLKPFVGAPTSPVLPLPLKAKGNQSLVEPLGIMDHRTDDVTSKNQVLVQWSGLFPEDWTWGDLEELSRAYPSLHLEDKVPLDPPSHVMTEVDDPREAYRKAHISLAGEEERDLVEGNVLGQG